MAFPWSRRASFLSHPALERPKIPPGTPKVRRRYLFEGRVQGVGFRYEARLAALEMDLTGFAENLEDGRVLCEVEGWEPCVREFLRYMQAVPRFCLTDVRVTDIPVLGTEELFRIF